MAFGNLLRMGMRQGMMQRMTRGGYSTVHDMGLQNSVSDWLKAWKNGFDTLTGQPTDEEQATQALGTRLQQLMGGGLSPQKAMVQALAENPQMLMNTVFSDPATLSALIRPTKPQMHVVGNSLVDDNGRVLFQGPQKLPPEAQLSYWATGGDPDNPTPQSTSAARNWLNAHKPAGRQPSSLMQMFGMWKQANPGADPRNFINGIVNQRTGGTTDNYDPTQPLPPAQEAMVDMWGHYGMQVPTGYSISRNPAIMNMMARLGAKYPNYDEKLYNQYNKGYQAFTSGTQGNTLRYLTAGLQHLNTLWTLGQQLHNGNIDALNSAAQGIAQATGQPAPTNMQTAGQIVGNEVLKAISGMGGAVAEGSKEKIQSAWSRAYSLPQIAGAIDTTKQLLAGQLHATGTQYHAATGLDFTKSGWLNTPEMQQLYNEAEQRANAAPPNLKATEQAGQSGSSQAQPNTSGGAQSGSQGGNSAAQAGPPPAAIKALQQGFVVNPDGSRTNVTPQQFDSYYGDGAAEAILNPSPANSAASPTPPDDDNGGQQQPAATAGQ